MLGLALYAFPRGAWERENALTALATEDSEDTEDTEGKLMDLGCWGVAFFAVFWKRFGGPRRLDTVLRRLPCRASRMGCGQWRRAERLV